MQDKTDGEILLVIIFAYTKLKPEITNDDITLCRPSLYIEQSMNEFYITQWLIGLRVVKKRMHLPTIFDDVREVPTTFNMN